MKECYFCHSEIPEDARVCPMCGSDLRDIEEKREVDSFYQSNPSESISPQQEPLLEEESKTRRKKSSFKMTQIVQAAARYLSFNFKYCVHPVQEDPPSKENGSYGYMNMVFAAILASIMIARIASASEKSYQILSQISILPSLTFRFHFFEWVWKLSLFFFLYFLLLSVLLMGIKKLFSKQVFPFHKTVTQFSGMSSLSYLLLVIGFVINLIAPLAMGVPVLLIVALHCLSYQTAFVSSLHVQKNPGENLSNKIFQLSLSGIAIHSILMFVIAYLLIKL